MRTIDTTSPAKARTEINNALFKGGVYIVIELPLGTRIRAHEAKTQKGKLRLRTMDGWTTIRDGAVKVLLFENHENWRA